MRSSFFIVLPSNDPSNTFGKNTPADFKIVLPKPLTFDAPYLCGLQSIVYPHSWASIGTLDGQYIDLTTAYAILRIHIPKGSFNTIESLVTYLNSVVQEELEKGEGRRKRNAPEEPKVLKKGKKMDVALKKSVKTDEGNPIPLTKAAVQNVSLPNVSNTNIADVGTRNNPGGIRNTTRDTAKSTTFSHGAAQPSPLPPSNPPVLQPSTLSTPITTSIATPSTTTLTGAQHTAPSASSKASSSQLSNHIQKGNLSLENEKKAPNNNNSQSAKNKSGATSFSPVSTDHLPTHNPAIGFMDVEYPRMSRPLALVGTRRIETEPLKVPVYELNRPHKTVKEPIKAMYNLRPLRSSDFAILYDKKIQRVKTHVNHEVVGKIEFSPQLKYTLGFSDYGEIVNETVAPFSPDLSGGIKNLAVYVDDLVEQVIVGSFQTPMLRMVTVKGKPGDVVEQIYDQPLMIPVRAREISVLHVQIRTLDGRLCPFDYGITCLTLCFKPLAVF
ncbi:unnamed protein product [Bursaphelenchus xylophilus]|uniref:(pine wood nematode) hypothetical protein n=1 Tax=Bursaphelenchus xylophilus TaxID=6326 RepID=A0A811JYN8_BURXY|nr:unnamed protein product [Bursaphelenchus xylophilus]CAG9081151.1 unnamed protein product [Bursaphelenchus xylophilus]